MNPKLSVIIPTYKRTQSLLRLLSLLEKQSKANEIEVLVIDQNEVGFLENEIRLSEFLSVRQIRQELPNASLARNVGAKNSEGEYLLFLDDDLVPDENFCERGMEFFTSYGFVDCFVPFVKNKISDEIDRMLGDKRVIKRWNDQLIEITDAMSAALFIKKKTFYISGGFDVLLFDFAKTAEDQEFFLRFLFKDLKLFYTPLISIFHDETQTGGCELRAMDYWITRKKCVRSLVFRYKIHRGGNLSLNFLDIVGLCRSVFFNRKAFSRGFTGVSRQIKLLYVAINDANLFLSIHAEKYLYPRAIDHLNSSN